MKSDEKNNRDDFLISELQNGQERAFDYIFRKYYKALCAQSNAFVNDLDKAQSLVQDCFVKLWLNRKEAKIKNLSSYLAFMVRNQCVDHIRKTKSLKKLHENAEKGIIEANSDDLMIAREFEGKFIVILTSLPERSRIAFEYSRFENFTYKEIAEKMNISVKAVEALISRALKTFRKELKDYLPFIILLLKLDNPVLIFFFFHIG